MAAAAAAAAAAAPAAAGAAGAKDDGASVEAAPWKAFLQALGAIERSDVRALRGLYDQHGPALTNRMLPDGTGTLLHYACRKAKRKAVAFLCEAGADPNNVDGDGETPLFWLATIARFDSHTVEMLEAMVTALGADINHRDYLGRVALTYACVRGTVDQIRRRRIAALLKLGADPRLRDYDEKAPVDYLGMCTNGGMWMDALPENEREMRRCRALLLDEMHRRDIRDILFSVRAKQGAEKAAAAAASVASGGTKRAATAEMGAGGGGGAAVAVPSAVPVERRLVELNCNEIFQLCMMYV